MMSLVIHLLVCRYSCSKFSTKSAIRICMALEEPRLVEMLGLYDRIAGEETESEVSDLEPETDSEVSENQEFSATPPTSLSSNEKLEWTFMAFSISNRINDTHGMIYRIRPIWATGHPPAPADVNTLKKTLEVMGGRMNGFMEVEAVQLKCRYCNETDPHRMHRLADPIKGIRES